MKKEVLLFALFVILNSAFANSYYENNPDYDLEEISYLELPPYEITVNIIEDYRVYESIYGGGYYGAPGGGFYSGSQEQNSLFNPNPTPAPPGAGDNEGYSNSGNEEYNGPNNYGSEGTQENNGQSSSGQGNNEGSSSSSSDGNSGSSSSGQGDSEGSSSSGSEGNSGSSSSGQGDSEGSSSSGSEGNSGSSSSGQGDSEGSSSSGSEGNSGSSSSGQEENSENGSNDNSGEQSSSDTDENEKEKSQDSFDEQFQNNKSDEPHKEYFDPPLGRMTRHYIYDSVSYKYSNPKHYVFSNTGATEFIGEAKEGQKISAYAYRMNFKKSSIEDRWTILPTVSADENIDTITVTDGIKLFWNKNMQLVADTSGKESMEAIGQVSTWYDYYDQKYDDGDISILKSERIGLDSKTEEMADGFLSSEESGLSYLKTSKSIKEILSKLTEYFSTFQDSENITYNKDNNPDIYQRIALGRVGACRHRAMAFFITANYLKIPTRYVYNDIHAFVEVYVPSNGKLVWKAIDLGGSNGGDYNAFPDPNATQNVSNSTDANANESMSNSSNSTNSTLPDLNMSNNSSSEGNSSSQQNKLSSERALALAIILFLIGVIIAIVLIGYFKTKTKKEDIITAAQKSEIELLIEEILSNAKKDRLMALTYGYSKLQKIISKKLMIQTTDDMTAREFLKSIPERFDKEILSKIVTIYERAHFRKTSSEEDLNNFVNEIRAMASL